MSHHRHHHRHHNHQNTWPPPSSTHHFTSLHLSQPSKKPKPHQPKHHPLETTTTTHRKQPLPQSQPHDFSAIPYDVLVHLSSSFTLPTLRAASLVCRNWYAALEPLREAMVYVRLGKRYKHGNARKGAGVDHEKALECFMKGAKCGSSLAMVDAGLICWELGRKEEGFGLYRKAAKMGSVVGMCNLGISYLQAEPSNPKEAVKWINRAAVAGNVRAQYQLALCLHQGRGVTSNLVEAAKWYQIAAEGGYVRAMYNISMCYSYGEGLIQSHKLARIWMKKAAEHGHSKAQFEYGLRLFSEGEMNSAVVYLELATRAGETAAVNVRNVILQQLSSSSRDRAMLTVENWRARPSSRRAAP